MAPAIEVISLWKSYRIGSSPTQYQTLREVAATKLGRIIKRTPRTAPASDFWALRDVNFEVGQGEVVGIIGRNGAGKTTSLKIMSRITRPTKGKAVIRGRVGSLLEVGTGFHPELTGRENVMLNGAILGMGRSEVIRKLDEIVDFSGLDKFIDTPVKRYSSGMQMRLAFSVAAHLEPEIMLVDEVLAVGDQEFQKKCLGRISEIEQEGRTVVFISHNMAAIQRICPRSLLLDGGELVADGPTQEVIEAYHRMTSPDEEAIMADLDAALDRPQFLGWSLSSDSASVGDYSIFSGEACGFVFRLGTPRPLAKAFFGIAIYSSDGTMVSSLSSFDIEESYSALDPGLHEIEFYVDSFPVSPGPYSIYVSLNTKDAGTIETWHAHPYLYVKRERESVQFPPPWEGVLSLPGKFQTRPYSPSRPAERS